MILYRTLGNWLGLNELMRETERRAEELRRPYGPPAHVWFD